MEQLHRKYYDNLKSKAYRDDTYSKDYVIILEKDNVLVGYTLFSLYEEIFNDNSWIVYYSGNTITDINSRNSFVLASVFFEVVKEMHKMWPQYKKCWFLLSKGFRTYKLLPQFFNRYFPADTKQDKEIGLLLYQLAQSRFGKKFNKENGIIEMNGAADFINDALREEHVKYNENKEVDFFCRKNPGFIMGDELVCGCSLSVDNIKKGVLKRLTNNSIVSWEEETPFSSIEGHF